MFNIFKKKEFYLELQETPEQKEQELKKAAQIEAQKAAAIATQETPVKVAPPKKTETPVAAPANTTTAAIVEEQAPSPVVPEPPKEVNFADTYLMGGPRRDRRTAGPSLDQFKVMARSVNR
ncbi:MAG: hypothetical protein HC796_12755 [Synechococcaceae cyanobacterium RL_1_2]|nr:hypothetical protein [Synechococcaceae cyanobacterium RL_1_2]